jgi:alkanesulfonate monooxygenase
MLDFNETIRIFATCPQSKDVAASNYMQRVVEISTWSDAAGCTGMLIYSDNSLVDPWLVADTVLRSTQRLCPLVAVQPVYMHPYSAAKMVASCAFMHGRRLWLNMLAGGFRNDLVALGDKTPHDERYSRTAEYALIMRRLLEGDTPLTFAGKYYNVQGLRMTPPLPSELAPGFFISGSSEAGRAAALAIGATSVEYPRPPDQVEARRSDPSDASRGLRIGLIARADAEEAWRVAWARFPADRRGRLAHALAMQTSDSAWHHQLSQLAREKVAAGGSYWLWPFENYQTFCPYLVGDFDTVAAGVARYLDAGYDTFILDIPRDPTDLETAGTVLRGALAKAGRRASRASQGPLRNGQREDRSDAVTRGPMPAAET